jgi:signal recognition particle receptor subunit beta
LEVEDSVLNEKKVSVWDLGGQERFKFMWKDFLRGAGLAVLVCDSTEEGVKKTKEIYDRFERSLGTKIIAIANKQDLPEAMTAQEVQARLGGLKTYGMTAIYPEFRQRIKEILEYEVATF